MTPKDVEKEAILQGIKHQDLKVPSFVILTFNKSIIKNLIDSCNLEEWDWPVMRYNPYYSPCRGWKGIFNRGEIAVFVPPMGSSPVSVFCEDLLYFGAYSILLLCASWSLGETYLHKGQLHLPNIAIGFDGTSIHYGNKKGKIKAEVKAFRAINTSAKEIGADCKIGGVGSFEAFYRITPEIIKKYRKLNCLSVDNGEAAILFTMGNLYNLPLGVLFQPYIDLEKGWNISYMGDEYKESCKLQSKIALRAFEIIGKNHNRLKH